MSASTCGQCGGELEEEDGFLTCTQCGNCQETSNYAVQERQEFSQNYSTNGVHQPECAVTSRRKDLRIRTTAYSQSLNTWRKIISAGSDALRINRTSRERAIQLFEKAFRQEVEIRKRHQLYKRGMCAACLHVACCDDSQVISISEICEAVQAKKSSYYKAMKDLKRVEEVVVAKGNRLDEDSVAMCIRRYSIGEVNLHGTVLQILELAKENQIDTGCKADSLILAAAFLAWQRETTDGFKKGDLELFLKKGSTSKFVVIYRLRELRAMLHFMLKRIPWLDSSKVREDEAVKYLEEITKHQESVKMAQISSDSDSKNDNDTKAQFKLKRRVNYPKYSSSSNPSCSDISVLTRGQDLDRPDLDENDIPESEIAQYIYQDKAKLESLSHVL